MLRTAEHERPISFIILSSLVWCYPRLPSRLRMIAVTCLYHVCLCPDMSWEEKLFSGWLLYTGWSLNLQDPFRILRLRFRIDSESFSLKWLDSTFFDTTIERHRQTWASKPCADLYLILPKSFQVYAFSSQLIMTHTHTPKKQTNNIYSIHAEAVMCFIPLDMVLATRCLAADHDAARHRDFVLLFLMRITFLGSDAMPLLFCNIVLVDWIHIQSHIYMAI